ncbi:hypothetical protein DDE18_08865 [Nocardioides gansuensis]|uniref:Uncharacterized protein n=1 Tax=Nocardioides gansuensis TaxID=2138300 RepID=A0A2T8FCF4_9ACTN|nr:hypothetical protein [Nocardioides gansuensis]PVG83391.1 hypothetical protein DDE18_08865 [Nocardioides gansuensis]
MGTLRAALGVAGLVMVLCSAGAATGQEPVPRSAPATPDDLPEEVRGGVVVDLADGDRFKVTVARNLKTVWGTRYDAASGGWGERRPILRKDNLYCGDVDARAAGGAVAVIAECDRFGYAEDQAPVASHALYSSDTVTWMARKLPGEAYDEPGIAPGGTAAVWPLHQGYVTWTAAEGFVVRELSMKGQEYTVTAVIDDAGTVSVLYATVSRDGGCALVALTRAGDATPTRQEVPLPDICGDVDLLNVDASSVLFGEVESAAETWVVSRETPASPWAVTAIAPAHAPGLEDYAGGRLGVSFFEATDLPLLALGSRDRRSVLAHVYDRVAQRWGSPVTVHVSPDAKCSWGDNWTEGSFAVIAADLECGDRHWILATTDGTTWHSLPMQKHPLGVSADGSLVAVPSRSTTTVLSRERGVVKLPVGATERCDLVVPAGPDAAVRLTSRGRRQGWPTVIEQSSPDGWKRLAKTRVPTYDVPCRHARAELYERPYRYTIYGGLKGYAVRLVEDGDDWRAKKLPY